MLIRCELARRDKFEIESGRHRFDSLFITLEGEYEYSVGKTIKRILPYQPVIFKKGAYFFKRVIRPVEFIIISPAELHYEGDVFLHYGESDRLRLENTAYHLKKAILEGQIENVAEHFFNDILFTANADKTVPHDQSVLCAHEYILQNFDKAISLSELAERSDCSVQTLISKFRRCYGKTPTRYMIGLRIYKAKDLLMNTPYSIAQIAECCGYDNVYYFSNSFKKETGISPLKFRQGYML